MKTKKRIQSFKCSFAVATRVNVSYVSFFFTNTTTNAMKCVEATRREDIEKRSETEYLTFFPTTLHFLVSFAFTLRSCCRM